MIIIYLHICSTTTYSFR